MRRFQRKVPSGIRAPVTGFPTIDRRVAYKDIKGEREKALIRQYKDGDRRAGETLLLAHAPLIARVVKRLMHRSHHDLEPGDLLSEAQLGFLEGVKRFDFSIGTRLSTYATHWALSYAGRSADDTGATIRVPVHVRSSLKKNPDTELAQCAKNAFGVCSLDAFLETEEGDVVLHRSIADDSPAQDDRIVANESLVLARRALDNCELTTIEREIVLKRVMSDEPETLDIIGQRFGLSRERIRQLEQSAINKIRRSYNIVAAQKERLTR